MKFVCFKKDNKNAVSLHICLLKALVGFHQDFFLFILFQSKIINFWFYLFSWGK